MGSSENRGAEVNTVPTLYLHRLARKHRQRGIHPLLGGSVRSWWHSRLESGGMVRKCYFAPPSRTIKLRPFSRSDATSVSGSVAERVLSETQHPAFP